MGSKYAATIARFRDVDGQMDGCGAYFAAETQHAGQAVWEGQNKNRDDYTKTRKWSGLTSMLLESHIDGHHNAFVNLTEAVPTSTTRSQITVQGHSIQMSALYRTSNPKNIVPIKSSMPMKNS